MWRCRPAVLAFSFALTLLASSCREAGTPDQTTPAQRAVANDTGPLPPFVDSTTAALSHAFRRAARRALPAVVFVEVQTTRRSSGPLADIVPPSVRQGSGSGFVFRPDGYIITNNHVVADAVDVEVLLADRRQFKGRVVATDPKTDVAVVKIEAGGLPVVPWGDSSTLAVGDFVLAIGNPLGLNQTVTFGIVSAVGRADVGVADYEDFIQTDAPINPGNSGGALVNVKGELIGINTAIASTTGGSVGVGFAVPSNMARAAMQSLLKTGRVVRGFLGANTQDVTPLLSKIFRLPDVKGVIVTDIFSKGSAEKAGLRRGDVVLRFDGKDVVDSGKLRNVIALALIGSRHKLDLIRDNKPLQAELVIQEAPRERTRRAAAIAQGVTMGHPLGGLLVEEVTPPVARQLGLDSTTGVVVTAVEEGSLAESAGISMGDQILEVNRKAVPDLEAYQRLVEPIKPKDLTLLLINRQGTILFVPIEGE